MISESFLGLDCQRDQFPSWLRWWTRSMSQNMRRTFEKPNSVGRVCLSRCEKEFCVGELNLQTKVFETCLSRPFDRIVGHSGVRSTFGQIAGVWTRSEGLRLHVRRWNPTARSTAPDGQAPTTKPRIFSRQTNNPRSPPPQCSPLRSPEVFRPLSESANRRPSNAIPPEIMHMQTHRARPSFRR